MQVEPYHGDAMTWNSLVAASPYGHVLQSYEWGEVRRSQGQRPLRVLLREDDCIVGIAQIFISELPGSLGRYAYVPKGPVIDYAQPEMVVRAVVALQQLARDEDVLALKIEPEVRDSAELRMLFTEHGLVPTRSVQPRQTIWIDLQRDPEEILAAMKQKTRYNTRLAAKRGVKVCQGKGEQDLIEWYDLFRITAIRDRFAIRPLAYYQRIMDLLGEVGMVSLLLARHDGELLAGNILFHLGSKAIYMYGASSNQKRNLMPTYLLQWSGMQWARARGAAIYDLWGVSDHMDDDLAGVSRFKEGFGGELVRYVGAFDYVRAPLRHRMIEEVVRPLMKRVAGSGLRAWLSTVHRLQRGIT
jgi:lipid II:glycine glycyltransferase (peptidoglycan interpeptide bridge formation enzyme)